MSATQRAVYEQATRIDAELYAFALSVHEHLTAAVRAVPRRRRARRRRAARVFSAAVVATAAAIRSAGEWHRC